MENVNGYVTRNKDLVLIFSLSYHMTLGKLQITLGLRFYKTRGLNCSLRVHGKNPSALNILNFIKVSVYYSMQSSIF